MAKTDFKTVDDYIQTFPNDIQTILQTVRETIQKAVPKAEETISYQIPAFKYHGWIFYFSAYKKHFSLSCPPPFVAFKVFKDELSRYKQSKSVVQFPLDEPVPVELIFKMSQVQAKENIAREATAKETTTKANPKPATRDKPTKTMFNTTIKAVGNNTGIEVPTKNIEELGTSKKPAVNVNVSGYSYPSTVAVMGSKFMIPLSKAHREAAGLKGGDKVTVTLELETAPRTVEVPKDLVTALTKASVKKSFDALAFSKRKEFVRQVEEAKTQETRERRIAKILETLTKES